MGHGRVEELRLIGGRGEPTERVSPTAAWVSDTFIPSFAPPSLRPSFARKTVRAQTPAGIEIAELSYSSSSYSSQSQRWTLSVRTPLLVIIRIYGLTGTDVVKILRPQMKFDCWRPSRGHWLKGTWASPLVIIKSSWNKKEVSGGEECVEQKRKQVRLKSAARSARCHSKIGKACYEFKGKSGSSRKSLIGQYLVRPLSVLVQANE